MTTKDEILQQLDALIATGEQLVASFKPGEWASYHTDEPEAKLRAFTTGAFAAIVRVAGDTSEFYTTIPRQALGSQLAKPGQNMSFIPMVLGSLHALRQSVSSGYLTSLESKLRANVHDDFLTQAQELLSASYHVAAMVVAGGVLENHLHKLAVARGITWAGNGTISKYNDNLKDVLYPQPTWRRIQSVADVRNHAAHGNTATVNVDDVKDAIASSRGFCQITPRKRHSNAA